MLNSKHYYSQKLVKNKKNFLNYLILVHGSSALNPISIYFDVYLVFRIDFFVKKRGFDPVNT